ncbi:MAG: hypothetical protein HeimC2_29830 [Candidatus Heimdallarchaeota archaeon LC_2]|nr:MAG: hypothetical protein HeimC2_29830 [Candidatus Heimdallarchaeota archaeon LC_2]
MSDSKNPKNRNKKASKNKYSSLPALAFDVLRVVPESTKPTNNTRNDRLTDLIIVFLVFGIALWVRFWVSSLIGLEGVYGTHFNIPINEEDTLGIGKYLGVDPGTSVESEGYNDYGHYYIGYVKAFVDEKWNPYSGKLDPNDPKDTLNGYVYGPVYIYSIAFGKMFFDISAEDSIIWSNIIFDSASYSMVYILAKRVTGNIVAMVVAILGSLSPIAVYYTSVRFLNAPQMNFFTLVFIYFFLEHRDTFAMFFLAAASLTKQFPMFLLMPIGFFIVRRYGFLKGVAIYLLFFVFMLLLSVPWILLTPIAYTTKLFLPGQGKPAINCPKGGEATNLVNGELNLESCKNYTDAIANGSTPNPDDIQISSFGEFLFPLINNHTIFFGSLLLISLVGFTGYDYMEKNPKLYYRFFAAFFGIGHATIARGIYKYYLSFLIPLFILALVPGNLKHSPNIRVGAALHRSWRTWLNSKYRLGPITKAYWLYFLVLVASTLGIFWTLDLIVSLFTSSSGYHNLWIFILSGLALFFIIKPGSSLDNELEDSTPLLHNKRKDSINLIIIFSIAYGLKIIAKEYFNNDKDTLIRNQMILIFFLVSFLALPYFQISVTKSKFVVTNFTFSYSQVIMDIIGLVLAFYVINLFNIEIFLIHRYLTSSAVLAFSIFILGLMGTEVWGSYFKVYGNAYRKFMGIYNRSKQY